MALEKRIKGDDMGYGEIPSFESPKGESKKWGWWFLCLIAVLILLGYFWELIIPIRAISLFHRDYQAVFLTNGQVYFGKLYRETTRYPVLRDVYYLQITQAPQPIQENEPPPQNINLVKLGGELHGPSDEMRINREQILFIEDLKKDSRVFEAINQFKANQ